MKTQLLCTFTTKNNLDSIIKEIKSNYDIVFNKIYVLQNENYPKELICTYNVNAVGDLDYNLVASTISLHRKKHTNTLYTINALNEVIKNLNNGILDTSYKIPWENFQNVIMVTNSEGLNKISTRIFKIIKVTD
ncbi:hypothetical protein CL614_10750 [archaeon]|nr:hypothetical protein [archaeon]|tara:strand:+ start:89 stop:490 length:402 start_codon:yes stop_codon:yes gene_type:complete